MISLKRLDLLPHLFNKNGRFILGANIWIARKISQILTICINVFVNRFGALEAASIVLGPPIQPARSLART